MARQDNSFALLGEDDDGADVTVLIAKVEAKISTQTAPAAAAEQPKPKASADGFPSKPLPPSEYARTERGRGRGGRGRGAGREVGLDLLAVLGLNLMGSLGTVTLGVLKVIPMDVVGDGGVVEEEGGVAGAGDSMKTRDLVMRIVERMRTKARVEMVRRRGMRPRTKVMVPDMRLESLVKR